MLDNNQKSRQQAIFDATRQNLIDYVKECMILANDMAHHIETPATETDTFLPWQLNACEKKKNAREAGSRIPSL